MILNRRVWTAGISSLLNISPEPFPSVGILPLLSTSLDDRQWVAAVQQGQELPTVLVVEDDPLLQGIVGDALDEGGFKVAVVGSAEEAITLLKGKTVTYCALITDINLSGGMDGWEIARTAREIDAGFPIIYMTGAAGAEWPSKGVPNSILLNKPFAPAQLVTAVSQLLNTGAPPTA